MSFQHPTLAQLSQSNLVGTLGWQALDSSGTIVSAFTKTGVRIAGAITDYTAGVVTLPDTAALIQWGIDDTHGAMVQPCLASDPVSKPLDAPTIAAAVWNYLTSAATTTNSLGAYLLNRLGMVGSASVTVVFPVSIKGDVSLTHGDDYYAADGRALSWSSATWPNLTGATIHFIVEGGLLSVAGAVVTAGTGTQTVQVELSATNTAALVGSSYNFNIVATLADGHIVTLVDRSLMTVSA